MDNNNGNLVYSVVVGTELKQRSEEKKENLTEPRQNLEIDDLLGAKANYLSTEQRQEYLRNS